MKRHLREAARLGWGGARANLIPALALWLVGTILVVCYHQIEGVTRALDQVGEWKVTWSPWFAIASSSLFGSIVPAFIQRVLAPQSSHHQSPGQIFGLFLFWALMGLEIDLLYRTQAFLFGEGNDVSTIVVKTLVDQFIWNPFLGLPQTVIGYLLIEKNGSLKAFRQALRNTSFLQRAIPLLITTWVVWIPAVSLIYLFPSALQLFLMNIILALWCLILGFFAKNAEEAAGAP